MWLKSSADKVIEEDLCYMLILFTILMEDKVLERLRRPKRNTDV